MRTTGIIFVITLLITQVSCVNTSKNDIIQLFEEYGLEVKAPAKLYPNPSMNPNFTLHYTGLDDDQIRNRGGIYEVYILDWSYVSSVEKIEENFHHKFLPRFLSGSNKKTMQIAGKERIVHIKSYEEKGNIGKALAFVEGGVMYMFNVVGNHNIQHRFENFISSISFYADKESEKTKLEEVNIDREPAKDNITEEDLVLYESNKYVFSIGIPENWLYVEDFSQMIVFIASPDEEFSKNVNITITRNVKRSLEDLVDGNKSDMKISFPDVKVLDEETFKINGRKTIKVDVKATDVTGTNQRFNSMYSFLDNNNLYIVNFGCNLNEKESYLNTIGKIINTFEIKNRASNVENKHKTDFEKVKLTNIGHISIPKNMELQSGDYRKISDKFNEKKAIKYGYEVASNKIVFQQKGLNELEKDGFSSYARIILETYVEKYGAFDKLTTNYSVTQTELRELNNDIRREIQIAFNKVGMRMIKWHSVSIEKINGISALKISYSRQLENNPSVLVNAYQFQNNDRIHKLTLSYRESDRAIWQPLFKEVLNSFTITNIR